MQQYSNSLKEANLFLGLTLGLSFLVFWGPLAFFKIPAISFVDDTVGPYWAIVVFIIGGFVPTLVSVLLTYLRQGMSGVRELTRRAFNIRIGWHWHLAIFAVVVLLTSGQLLLITLLGKTFDYHLFLAQLGSVIPLIILGPLSEELGWRGYALGRLQTKYSPITASLIVGFAWGLWHLPLFFMVGTAQHELHIPFVGFLFGVAGLSVLFTYFYNNTGGSIWSAVFFHWLYTYTAQVVASGVTRSPLYNWLEYLPHVILAVVVAAIWRTRNLSTGKGAIQRM